MALGRPLASVGLGRLGGSSDLHLGRILPTPTPKPTPKPHPKSTPTPKLTRNLGFYEDAEDGVEFVQTEPCKSAKNYLKGTHVHIQTRAHTWTRGVWRSGVRAANCLCPHPRSHPPSPSVALRRPHSSSPSRFAFTFSFSLNPTKGWFTIDFLSGIPYDLLTTGVLSQIKPLKMMKGFR